MELLRTEGENRPSAHSGLTRDLGEKELKKIHFYFLHKDLKARLCCKEILVYLKKCSSKNSTPHLEWEPAEGLDYHLLDIG